MRGCSFAAAMLALAGCSRPASTQSPPPTVTRHDDAVHAVAATPDVAPTSETPEPTTPAPATPAPSTAVPTPSAQALAAMPLARRLEVAVAPFDAATEAHVREVFAAGRTAGQRADVFAKLGDSITESGSFLSDIGHGWFNLGGWTRLEPTIQYFRRRSFNGDPEVNSFSHASVSATAGWTAGALLAEDPCPVERELAAIRPAFAILLIGTNDAERSNAERYERDLRELVRRIEARHVVLVLSTIPDQRSSAPAGRLGLTLNTIIRRVAAERHLPLVDYWAALQGLPDNGIEPDRVHPSVYRAGGTNPSGCVFTDAALAFGYNVRNLTTVLMLERLMRVLDLRG